MRIAILCPYVESRPYGGVSGVAYDTVEGIRQLHSVLEKNDIFIEIVSPLGSSYKMETHDSEKYSQMRFHKFKPLRPTSVFGDLEYLIHLKRLGPMNLIHSHDFYGAFYGVMTSRPTIFTLHGVPWREANFASGYKLKLMYKLDSVRLHMMYKHLKSLIAISPYIFNEIQSEINDDTKKMILIENPVSDIFFNLNKEPCDNLILCPGMINARKNQIALVHALSLVKKERIDFHLVLTGTIADSSYYIQLLEEIRKNNLQDNVSIRGAIPFEELLNYYSKSHVIVLPSNQETAPMAISEGMASGTPVIASRIAGIPYMIDNGNNGFTVNPGDINQFAEKIRLLLDDKKLCGSIGEKAKIEAQKRWNSKTIANKLLYHYTISQDIF